MTDCVSCKFWVVMPERGPETQHRTFDQAERWADANLKPQGIEYEIFREDQRPGCCG